MAISANTDFNRGDRFLYNGKEAVVVNVDSYSRYLIIEVDGKTFRVDKNDLFGMNKETNEDTDIYSSWIQSCDEQIADNAEIIKENNLIWNKMHNLIVNLRKNMSAILRDAGVSNYSQLDVDQRSEYLSLREQRTGARLAQIRATHEIQVAAIDTSSACSSKINAVHAQALANRA